MLEREDYETEAMEVAGLVSPTVAERLAATLPCEPPEPVRRFRDELGPAAELLDAGCGPGGATLAMAGETGVGLDISRAQLSLAQRTVTGELVQGDMTALPFATDSFDAISALYSLIHVPLADHRAVLAEFARVLRAGGTLLVTEGGTEWTGSNPDWLDSGTEMHWSMAGPDATRDDLEACGFELRGVWNVPDPATSQKALAHLLSYYVAVIFVLDIGS